MSRGADQRIADILQAIDECQRYVGEVWKHLPAEITDAHPEITWPQIRGFRNILVHQHFGVDVAAVCDVVKSYLPSLAEALRRTGAP